MVFYGGLSIQEHWGSAFYYGSDLNSDVKTYEIYDIAANGKGIGRIKIGSQDSNMNWYTTDGTLTNVTFNNPNNMTFEFWEGGEYGPVKFTLTRNT